MAKVDMIRIPIIIQIGDLTAEMAMELEPIVEEAYCYRGAAEVTIGLRPMPEFRQMWAAVQDSDFPQFLRALADRIEDAKQCQE